MNLSRPGIRVIAVVLLAGVLPLLVSVAADVVIGRAQHVNDPIHELLEVAGSCIALGVSLLMLMRLKSEPESAHLLWAVAALVAMGIVDGLHGVHGISLWSWQRHGATLIGGLLFGCVWLPLPRVVTRRIGLFVFVVAGLALALGLWWGSGSMPVTWHPEGLYTMPVKAANALGGLGFMAAALFFIRRYLREPKTEHLIFANHTLLFGTASLFFAISHTWAADWWVWHGVRLLAYLVLLAAAYETVGAIFKYMARHAEELEVRVQERSVELSQSNDLLQRQIDQREQADVALRESESRFRQIAESLPELIWTCEPDGPCDYLNRRWIEFTGVPEERQLGFGWLEQVHPDDRAPTVAAWNAAVASGADFLVEFRLRRHDGEYRWFDTRAVRLRDVAGRTVKWFGSNTDVTERKRAEVHLRDINAELEQHVQERTANLEAANKELEAFSYSVSHDLRAPLRAIDGYSRILQEDFDARLDDEGRRVLGVISAETRRMGQLIDDLLAFSRMNRQEMRSSDIDMTELARAVFDEQAALFPARALQLDLKRLLPARGDRAMVRVVLGNLLSNAIKFTRPRNPALIEVGSRQDDGQAVYYVKDDGVGFDPKYGHRLFGVFQRLHSTEEFEGTGVGLALVQRVILRHAGRVWAEGNVDQGATFYFSLPNIEGEP